MPPRRPSPRAKRLIFAYQGGQKVLLIIGTAFLLMGVPFTAVFTWRLPSDVLFAFGTRTTMASILPAAPLSPEADGRPVAGARYAYAWGDRMHSGPVDSLAFAAPTDLPPVVPIEVSTLVPSVARLLGATLSPFGFLGVFTLVFPIVGLGLFVSAVRSNRREKRAYVRGQPVTAQVVRAGPDPTTTINGRHPFKVDWEFRVADAVYTGSLAHMDASELRDLADAKQVTVLYDPDDPSANTAWIE
jgi:hypothetical protein